MNWLQKIAQQDLPHMSIDVYGRHFETGVPVEFRYVRNNESAPDFGSRYQQDIEPAGRYLTHNEDPGSEDYLAEMRRRGWEYGLAKFENPLVITFNTKKQINYDEHSWKAALSRKFGGFTGEALARAIVGQGYDGIVTVHANDKGEPLYVSEIVDLTGFVKQAQKAMPLPVAVDTEERLDSAGISRMDNKMTEDTANRLRQQYPEIEYGGAGAIGIVFQTGPNEIMKVTHDLSEANAAEYAFENSLDWVVPILEKPQMIQDNPPMWGIRMKKLRLIEDQNLIVFIHNVVAMDEVNQFPNLEQIGFIIENNFPDFEDADEALNIYAHMKYILDQNRQALWLGDIHGGNVGWDDDGHLKVFDLGPGDWVE